MQGTSAAPSASGDVACGAAQHDADRRGAAQHDESQHLCNAAVVHGGVVVPQPCCHDGDDDVV